MKKIFKIFLFFVIIFGSLEIVSWIYVRYYHPEIYTFIDNLRNNKPIVEFQKCISEPYLNYIPTPNRIENGFVQHNSHGYRGPLILQKRTEKNTFRILFMGGSTTYGWSVSNPASSYPMQVGQYLENKYGKIKFEIINAGLPWGTSAEILNHYLLKFRYYKPDLLIIHAGANDAQVMMYRDYQPDYSNFRRTIASVPPINEFTKFILRSNFIYLVSYQLFYSNFSSSSFVHNGECPYAKWYGNDMNYSLKNINEYAFYRNIKTIVNEAKCERTPVILFSEWGNPEFFEKLIKCETGLYQYNEDVLKKISEEESVYFIPFPKNKIPQATWSDDIHVNEIGEKILGNYVGQFIEERFFLSYK